MPILNSEICRSLRSPALVCFLFKCINNKFAIAHDTLFFSNNIQLDKETYLIYHCLSKEIACSKRCVQLAMVTAANIKGYIILVCKAKNYMLIQEFFNEGY